MGAFESGCIDSKRKAEQCASLDVRTHHHRGMLIPPHYACWQWTSTYTGEPWGTIALKAGSDELRLIYSVSSDMCDPKSLNYPVRLTRTPCHFGSSRVWFNCPGNGCGRRVAKLYLTESHFLCRQCARVVYVSQSRGPRNRAYFRAFRIQRRLGGEMGAAFGLPEKPNGMHWRIYDRVCLEYFLAMNEADKYLSDVLSRILSTGISNRDGMPG